LEGSKEAREAGKQMERGRERWEKKGTTITTLGKTKYLDLAVAFSLAAALVSLGHPPRFPLESYFLLLLPLLSSSSTTMMAITTSTTKRSFSNNNRCIKHSEAFFPPQQQQTRFFS